MTREAGSKGRRKHGDRARRNKKDVGGSFFSFITREATGPTRFQFARSMLTPEKLLK